MKSLFALLLSCCFLFGGCGCSMFGPDGSLTPDQQCLLVQKTSSVATRVVLNKVIDDNDRHQVALSVVYYASIADELLSGDGVVVSGEDANRLLSSLLVHVQEAVGPDVTVEDLRDALEFVLGFVLPNDVKLDDLVKLEEWQLDLLRSFVNGVLEGAHLVLAPVV